MKNICKLLVGIGLLAVAPAFQSCDKFDNDNTAFPNALVTVKPSRDGSYFTLQLDDDTVLRPVNMQKSPYGDKEVRALVNYRKPTEAELRNKVGASNIQDVYVNWLDSILTKRMADDLGAEENVETYGDSPIDIVNDWVTVVEDGYITLRLRTNYSGGRKHVVNLVHPEDADDPYHVRLYHDAKGIHEGPVVDGIVAFRLDKLKSPTESKEVDLTLEWKSYMGIQTVKFKYRPRT